MMVKKPFETACKAALRHCQKALGSKAKLKAEKPRLPEHGDVAVALFEAAKDLKKNPVELALHIAGEKPPEEFCKVNALGPYVNFFYSQEFLAKHVKASLNIKPARQNKKVAVIEYSQPNPGKPMHFGHIRSTILGDVASRLLAFTGVKAIRMNYLNDRGSHIAELITALQEFKDLPEVRNEKNLLEYYVKIKSQIDSNPALKEKSRAILTKMDEGDRQTLETLEKIRAMSWNAFQRNYSLLGIAFDEVFCETTILKEAMKAVDECVKKGIAFVDKDGTTIIDLEKHGLPNTVLLRSNKSPIYLTSDLALADYKWKKYAFTESVYFTASEQNLHFQQLFKTLALMGRPYVGRLKHVGFGLISLPQGKMSTRAGRVVLLEDVLNESVKYAREEVEKREKSENIEDTAKAIGVGSLKFAILKITAERNILFNPRKAVGFEGDTGAYVQYAHVRCASILEKTGKAKASVSKDFDASEEKLAKKIIEFGDVVEHAAIALQPHALCDYLLTLGHEFNSFYSNSPVLNSERQAQRLSLVKATRQTLKTGLELLGIKAIEKM